MTKKQWGMYEAICALANEGAELVRLDGGTMQNDDRQADRRTIVMPVVDDATNVLGSSGEVSR